MTPWRGRQQGRPHGQASGCQPRPAPHPLADPAGPPAWWARRGRVWSSAECLVALPARRDAVWVCPAQLPIKHFYSFPGLAGRVLLAYLWRILSSQQTRQEEDMSRCRTGDNGLKYQGRDKNLAGSGANSCSYLYVCRDKIQASMSVVACLLLHVGA